MLALFIAFIFLYFFLICLISSHFSLLISPLSHPCSFLRSFLSPLIYFYFSLSLAFYHRIYLSLLPSQYPILLIPFLLLLLFCFLACCCLCTSPFCLLPFLLLSITFFRILLPFSLRSVLLSLFLNFSFPFSLFSSCSLFYYSCLLPFSYLAFFSSHCFSLFLSFALLHLLLSVLSRCHRFIDCVPTTLPSSLVLICSCSFSCSTYFHCTFISASIPLFY